MFKILEKLTAKNKKQDDIRMPSHLSAAEQKQVQTVIDRARGDRTIPHSAQESIPFQRMFPDGICRVTDNYYTKTIQFQDINYQLAQQEDQTAIFEEWCSFLNFFDSSIRFELSFMPRQKMSLLHIRHPATIGSSMKLIGIRWPYAAQRKRRLMPIRKRTVLTKSSRASAS